MPVLVLTTDPARVRRIATELAARGTVVETDPSRARAALEGVWTAVLIDAEVAGAVDLVAEGARRHPVLVIARNPSMDFTMEVIGRGAREVLRDPADVRVLRRWLDSERSERVAWQRSVEDVGELVWVGRSVASHAVFGAAARTAITDAHVLIVGERGAGKELIARIVHSRSSRSEHRFSAVNCAALDDVGLAAELFGQDAALTGGPGARAGQFERVADGTVFLDEVGALSPALQARISRALRTQSFESIGSLESKPLKARVMASTSQDLQAEVMSGRFDESLYYAFGAQIQLPPLRQRGEDIAMLASYFLEHYALLHNRPVSGFTSEVMTALERYDWPGNVRQLRNAVERAVVSARSDLIEMTQLPTEITGWREDIELADTDGLSLEAIERRHIRRVLQMTGGRIAETADILGIHRNTLRRKLEQYGISSND